MDKTASASGIGGDSTLSSLEYRIDNINSLALPKSRQNRCELTGLVARVALITKHITLYYASREHAESAWYGIIMKIQSLLAPLRAADSQSGGGSGSDSLEGAAAGAGSSSLQQKSKAVRQSKLALAQVCQMEATEHLLHNKATLSMPAAMMAAFFIKDTLGVNSFALVPIYLILAEANLLMGKFSQCEEYLAMVNWSLINATPEAVNTATASLQAAKGAVANTVSGNDSKLSINFNKAALYKLFGKLYIAQGKLKNAQEELGKAIYSSSIENGPEHVCTATGYYLLGTIFFTNHEPEPALALFDKSVDIWYATLIRNNNTESEGGVNEDKLSHLLVKEGLEMLRRIQSTRSSLLGSTHIASGEAQYVLGLLLLYAQEQLQAKSHFESAYKIYSDQLGEEHASTVELRRLLTEVKTSIEIRSFDASTAGSNLIGGDLDFANETGIESMYSNENGQNLGIGSISGVGFPSASQMKAPLAPASPLASSPR